MAPKNLFFEVKVKYVKVEEKKPVAETFIADAVTFADAEDQVTKEISQFANGYFSVESIKKSNISEILNEQEDDGLFFKAKVFISDCYNVSEKPKGSSTNILVKAENSNSAIASVEKVFEKSLADWKITEIRETKITDIITNE